MRESRNDLIHHNQRVKTNDVPKINITEQPAEKADNQPFLFAPHKAKGTGDKLIVSGDLEMMQDGRIRFSQLLDSAGVVVTGDKIVTSDLSDTRRKSR